MSKISGEIQTFAKKPDGLLVVQTEQSLSAEEVEQIAARWKELAHDWRIVVLAGGLRINELTDADLAQVGLVRVHDGFKAVLVSDQLLAHWNDWTGFARQAEGKVVPTENPLIVDVQTRYVAE